MSSIQSIPSMIHVLAKLSGSRAGSGRSIYSYPYKLWVGGRRLRRVQTKNGHPALEQNVLGGIWSGGDNLPTTTGPLTVSLGLSLAIYCGINDDGMMTATLAAPRDPMIRFLDR